VVVAHGDIHGGCARVGGDEVVARDRSMSVVPSDDGVLDGCGSRCGAEVQQFCCGEEVWQVFVVVRRCGLSALGKLSHL